MLDGGIHALINGRDSACITHRHGQIASDGVSENAMHHAAPQFSLPEAAGWAADLAAMGETAFL
ncbi:hypothetical protein D3C72_2577540 [compost metagenome]